MWPAAHRGAATGLTAHLGQVQRPGHDNAHGHVAALTPRGQPGVVPAHSLAPDHDGI